jgi:hypothetical protein
MRPHASLFAPPRPSPFRCFARCVALAGALGSTALAEQPASGSDARSADAARVRRLATAACTNATAPAAVTVNDDAERRTRARWAPALPNLALRGHLGDGGFRRLDGETLVTGETLTASRSIELRVSWSLDELVYRGEELALARFEAERRAHVERARHQCGELAARWLRAKLAPDRDDADERAAFTALDIATAGALSRAEGTRDGAVRERSP